MTLLYLYVEKFGIIEKAEFNFSDKYRFHYDPKAQQISEVTNSSVGLPDDIFSFAKEERVVDCISAIVGRNASGKTSVASILADIISNPRPSTEFIIIWQTFNEKGKATIHKYGYILENVFAESEFESRLSDIQMPHEREKLSHLLGNCYSSDIEQKRILNRDTAAYQDALSFCELTPFLKRQLFDMEEVSLIDVYLNKNLQSFPDLIYITNNYTPFGGVIPNFKGISNLSTSCLIKTDSETYKNPSADEFASLKQGDSIKHDQLELLRMVRLFHDMSSEGSKFLFNNLSLPHPIKIVVSLDGHEINSISQHLQTKTIRNDRSDLPLTGAAITFQDLVLSIYMNSSKWSLRCFAAFLGNWLKYLSFNKVGSEHWEKEIHDFVDEFNKLFNSYQATDVDDASISKYLADSLDPNSSNALSRFRAIREKFTEDSASPDKSLHSALELYSYIESQSALDINGTDINFNLTDVKMVDVFRHFVKIYFNSNTITQYLSYRWHPHLSAGEYAQYFLYSRLYQLKKSDDKSAMKDQGPVRLIKSYILFFDEIEVTIHPDLQRQLMSNVIAFLESTFGKSIHYHYRFHIIFASHSPILLSDIPRSNVVFLECQKAGAKTTTKAISESDLATKSTFGANIHTLYRDSFFLEKSLIGSFATHVINQIITSLKKNSRTRNKLLPLINIIDEPVIKASLLSRYFNSVASEDAPDEESIIRKRLAEIKASKVTKRSK